MIKEVTIQPAMTWWGDQNSRNVLDRYPPMNLGWLYFCCIQSLSQKSTSVKGMSVLNDRCPIRSCPPKNTNRQIPHRLLPFRKLDIQQNTITMPRNAQKNWLRYPTAMPNSFPRT